MTQLFANNATSTLASDINNSVTSLTVATGEGARFPSPTGLDYFFVTLTGASSETTWEIVKCTSRSSDVLTIERGQQGTSAASWSTGDKVELRATASLHGDPPLGLTVAAASSLFWF